MFDGVKLFQSTSVGDMVLLSSGKKYKCEMTGWSKFNEDNQNAIF